MKVIFSFFMPKFKYKELIFMFSDSVLEKIFAMPDMQMEDLRQKVAEHTAEVTRNLRTGT